MIVVSVDSESGTLRRYTSSGRAKKLTHVAAPEVEGHYSFAGSVVEGFRLMPDDRFSVEPPPRPTSPPAVAVRRAA